MKPTRWRSIPPATTCTSVTTTTTTWRSISFSGAGAFAALTPPTLSIGGNPKSISVVSTVGGTFAYAVNGANNTVQQLTEGAGGLLSVTSTSATTDLNVPNYLAVDASGQFAYVTDRGSNPTYGTTVSQYSITPIGGTTPGALTLLSTPTATTGTQPTGIATAY